MTPNEDQKHKWPPIRVFRIKKWQIWNSTNLKSHNFETRSSKNILKGKTLDNLFFSMLTFFLLISNKELFAHVQFPEHTQKWPFYPPIGVQIAKHGNKMRQVIRDSPAPVRAGGGGGGGFSPTVKCLVALNCVSVNINSKPFLWSQKGGFLRYAHMHCQTSSAASRWAHRRQNQQNDLCA